MTFRAELMEKAELHSIQERYDIMPEMTQRLLRHEKWLQELIFELQTQTPEQKMKSYFQRREKQRKENEREMS